MCIGVSPNPQASRLSQQDLILKRSGHTGNATISTSSSTKRPAHLHIIVQHDYHDHAFDEAPHDFDSCEFALRTSGSNTAFPLKLFDMLERVDHEGLSHIVSWQPHGRAFLVHKPDEFAKILPHYFKQKKIASFQRQLNLYGFMRLTRGPDRGCYYHERFLRGKAFLIAGISRCKVKGTGVRARSNPEQEPNFWKMPWLTPNTTSNGNATATMNTSSSIVSEEEHRMQQDEDNDDFADLEPLPIQSSSQSASDVIMSGWGMPFYYLNSSTNHDAKLLQEQTILHPEPQKVASSTWSHGADDILDDVEFEKALEALLQDGDEGDLAQQLEDLVA